MGFVRRYDKCRQSRVITASSTNFPTPNSHRRALSRKSKEVHPLNSVPVIKLINSPYGPYHTSSTALAPPSSILIDCHSDSSEGSATTKKSCMLLPAVLPKARSWRPWGEMYRRTSLGIGTRRICYCCRPSVQLWSNSGWRTLQIGQGLPWVNILGAREREFGHIRRSSWGWLAFLWLGGTMIGLSDVARPMLVPDTA